MRSKLTVQRAIASALILLQLYGCSAFKASTEVVSVTADPPDAEVYINGNLAGHGSASQPVKRSENVQIMVRKGGFETEQRSIGTHMSTTGVLDIIGGVLFLVPFIGLATDGSRDLDQTNIAVTLRPTLAPSDATGTHNSK
jgi:PEGA domain